MIGITRSGRTSDVAGDPFAGEGVAWRTVMYTPSARGGHARYSKELLEALIGTGRVEGLLVTSEDLDREYWGGSYQVEPLLPALADRGVFRSQAAWAVGRFRHYARREKRFLRWIESQPWTTPTVVHVQEYAPWLARRHYRRLRKRGFRVVATVHNLRPHRGPRFGREIIGHLYRRGWAECDALIVHTADQADALQGLCSRHDVVLETIQHPTFTVAGPSGRPEERRPHEPLRLLAAGQIRRNKGLVALVEGVHAAETHVHLIIAGEPSDPALVNELRTLIVAGSVNRVDLIDRFVSEGELHTLLEWADAAAFLYDEAFTSTSGALALARAYHLPVIASPAPVFALTVRDIGDGIVVDDFSPHSIAEGIRQLADPAAYNKLRGAALRVRHPVWSEVAETTLAVYSGLPCI